MCLTASTKQTSNKEEIKNNKSIDRVGNSQSIIIEIGNAYFVLEIRNKITDQFPGLEVVHT